MIRFPGLGIEVQVSKVAFSIGGMEVYWYAIFLAIPIILFLVFAKKIAKYYQIKYEDILDLLLYVVPISFVGARVYYLIFSWKDYILDPIRIFYFHDGGLALYGGLIAGAITIYLFCKKRKLCFWDITDSLVPFLVIGQAIGRWGNFINQEAFGTQTMLPWRMELLQKGEIISVHPTFLYESIACFLIALWLFHLVKKRKWQGELTYWYITLYSFVRFWIEGIRSDSLLFYGVRISQFLSLALFVVFCLILTRKNKRNQKRKKQIAL